jgi:hypothetical protein
MAHGKKGPGVERKEKYGRSAIWLCALTPERKVRFKCHLALRTAANKEFTKIK